MIAQTNLTNLLDPEALKSLLATDKPQEANETIEAILNLLFSLPPAITKQLEEQIKRLLPNNPVKISIGTYQGKKALQVIICEA